MVSRSKPAPDIFLLAAQQIGCEPENCYVFEDGTKGMVQNINRDSIGCILFGDDDDIQQGTKVKRTKKKAGRW